MIRLVFSVLILLYGIVISSCNILTNDVSPKPDKLYVVITFDDQHQSIGNVAVPIMIAAGLRATNFINTGYVGRAGRISWEMVEELEFVYGWETGGHTLHHVYLPNLPDEEATFQIEQDWRNLKDRGLSCETFALPSGAASPRDYEILVRFYQNIRNSQNFRMFKPLDRLNIGYFAVRNYHSSDDIIARINEGLINKESLVVIGFHRFNEPEHSHNCNEDVFQEVVDFLNSNSLEVITLKEAVKILS